MSADSRIFVDTNVLIYARDGAAGDKRDVATLWLRRLVTQDRILINLQVINELTRWVLRNEAVSLDAARARIDELRGFGDAGLQAIHTVGAWAVRERLGYQWFDCLLIAFASAEGCRYFLSEDMGHETRYGDLTIINPFRVDPDAFLRAN
jgi:predicted nucleic acid-binding protein